MHLRTQTYTFYTSRFRLIKFLAPLPGRSFRVDIEKTTIRYYSRILIFCFYFIFTSASNLVFLFRV